jgi:hypothetical protein
LNYGECGEYTGAPAPGIARLLKRRAHEREPIATRLSADLEGFIHIICG